MKHALLHFKAKRLLIFVCSLKLFNKYLINMFCETKCKLFFVESKQLACSNICSRSGSEMKVIKHLKNMV